MNRKILSVIGLALSIIMLPQVKTSLSNLHGHTTSAAIYLSIFLVGIVIAWVSVTSPDI